MDHHFIVLPSLDLEYLVVKKPRSEELISYHYLTLSYLSGIVYKSSSVGF
jgi:hypothetical protein